MATNIGTDLLEQLGKSVGSLASTAVKTTLNVLWPNEFELYMVSLELTDADDTTLDYFTFPINPNSMTKTEPYIKDIGRSFGAVVVNKTGKFAPQDITIKGNFGKEFKMLIRNTQISFKALVKKNPAGMDGDELSPIFKNGYGCFKVLQNLCKRSDELDNGKSRRLYFHNFILGESYLVEVLDFVGDMNMPTNMLWNYTLRLKVLTPINVSKKTRTRMAIVGQSQKILTSAVQGAKNLLTTQDYL